MIDWNKAFYQAGLGLAMAAVLFIIVADNLNNNNQAILQLATGTFGTIVGFIISQLSGKQAAEQAGVTQAQTQAQTLQAQQTPVAPNDSQPKG